MADEVLSIDPNNRPIGGGVTNDADLFIQQFRVDATSKGLLVQTVGSSGANATLVDDAAFTPGTSIVTPVGFLADETATDSLNEGDIGAGRITLDRKQIHASEFVDDAAWVAGSYVNVIGGVYDDTSTDTLDEGDAGYVRVDTNRNMYQTLGTLLAGEDQSVGVMKVEHQYSYQSSVAADTQVKAAAGFIHTVTFACGDAAPTAGTIIIYDNTAESGTILFDHEFTTTPFVPFTITLDMVCATGIYIGFTTTADVNVSMSYR